MTWLAWFLAAIGWGLAVLFLFACGHWVRRAERQERITKAWRYAAQRWRRIAVQRRPNIEPTERETWTSGQA